MSIKNNFNKKAKRKFFQDSKKIGEEFSFNARENHSYKLEKTLSVFTSLDTNNPKQMSLSLISKSLSYENLLKQHKKEWIRLWEKADTKIDGDRHTQRVMRMHAYHLLSTYSPHVKNLNVGIPARGLTGEAYHGHVFWDEIFIMPFFIHHFPDIAKSSLLYRCRRLKQAQDYAKENDYNGAMYPWQSADSGKEETQTIHYNPQSKKWGPDFSRNQRHISIAIFYNFYKYLQHTKDKKFLDSTAAKTMIEIARFWANISIYNHKTKKYHIHGVMGPDEFHEHYPRTKKAVSDNAYTNVLVSWLLEKSIEMTGQFSPKIKTNLSLSNEELKNWKHISNNLNVKIKNGIIMQFSGYEKLKELNWKHYQKKYGNIERLDRILKKEGKSPDNYKISKQADVLMIFYLLSFKEAVQTLRKLGVKINNPIDFIRKNYDYYASRTTHGSSLSRFVHDAIATTLRSNKELWKHFKNGIGIDLYDTQGGTTSEGIHVGLMAGTINFVRKYFAGVKTHKNGVTIIPYLPNHWHSLCFKLTHQKRWYDFCIEHKEIVLKHSNGNDSKVKYQGKKYELKSSQPLHIKL